MIYANRFAYKTSLKSLESVSETTEQNIIENAVVGFIHVEEKDEANLSNVETKLVKNLKWAARKNNTKRMLLHSFTHLSESKASSEATRQLLDDSEQRLKNVDCEVYQTPFGYFLDLDVKAPGNPLARLFKFIFDSLKSIIFDYQQVRRLLLVFGTTCCGLFPARTWRLWEGSDLWRWAYACGTECHVCRALKKGTLHAPQPLVGKRNLLGTEIRVRAKHKLSVIPLIRLYLIKVDVNRTSLRPEDNSSSMRPRLAITRCRLNRCNMG